MRRLLLCLAVGLLIAADNPKKDDPAKKELETLKGKWTMVALEINGKLETEERIKDVTLEIKADKYIVTTRGKTHEMSIKVDPTKKPREIDMVFAEGAEKDKVHKGIYKIDGDKLILVRHRLPDKDRPTDFGTWPDTDTFMVTWQREKK